MDQRDIKAIYIKQGTDLHNIIKDGYRVFLVNSVDPSLVLQKLNEEGENFPYFIFLMGDHDLESLYKFIGDTIGFQHFLQDQAVPVYKGMSKGIYEWPDKIYRKFVLCYPDYKGDAGGFILVECTALYNYADLKSSRLFDERDSDEIDLIQKNFKNSVRRGRLIGVFSESEGFPKGGERKNILKHGAHIIFETPKP